MSTTVREPDLETVKQWNGLGLVGAESAELVVKVWIDPSSIPFEDWLGLAGHWDIAMEITLCTEGETFIVNSSMCAVNSADVETVIWEDTYQEGILLLKQQLSAIASGSEVAEKRKELDRALLRKKIAEKANEQKSDAHRQVHHNR